MKLLLLSVLIISVFSCAIDCGDTEQTHSLDFELEELNEISCQ